MDTHTLVKTQVEDAERWLSQLKNDGFPISAAFWAKCADEERWSFYLATPALEEVGMLKSIGKVLQTLRSLGEVTFRGSDILKLVDEKDRIVKDVLDFQKRFPELSRKKLKGQRLGGTTADLYIYSPEVSITIYGMVYRGDPSGALLLSFKPHNLRSKLEVESRGIFHEYPGETGLDWLVAAPEGAKLDDDRMHLNWSFRGTPKQSSANQIMALADLRLHGFRILSEPAKLKSASVV